MMSDPSNMQEIIKDMDTDNNVADNIERKYTRRDLVTFGMHVLSNRRTVRVLRSCLDDPETVQDRNLKSVHDADIANWEDEQNSPAIHEKCCSYPLVPSEVWEVK